MNHNLVELALRVNWSNLALGHRTFQAEGATFVVNPAHPSIHDANFVYGAAAESEAEVDRLIARARREYAHATTLTFRLGPGAPRPLEARLALEGTERSASLVMLLEAGLQGSPRPIDLRPLVEESQWEALLGLRRDDWREHAPKIKADPEDATIPAGLSATNRSKCPPVRYWLAYVDGRAAGYFNAWVGLDGVGQVEDLYVAPEFRRRGVATALLHRCVRDARERGAGPIVICSDPADTPKRMYAAMGWRPIAVCRQYGMPVRHQAPDRDR